MNRALSALTRNFRALFVLDNFLGWKRRDDWGDISFVTEHDQEIAKIAAVGEEQWRDLVCAGTGLVRMPQMMKAGIWLNLAGILVITALCALLL